MGEEATPVTPAATPAEPTTPAAPTAADRAYDPTPQTSATPAAETTPAPPAAQPGQVAGTPPAAPWSESLQQRFQDEGVRSQVDAYLRETVQPYVTQLEQSNGQVGEIWNKLMTEDPEQADEALSTYLALTEARFGPQVALAVANELQAQLTAQNGEPNPEDENTDVTPEFEDWLKTQPAEVQKYWTEEMERREDASYEQDLQQLAAQNPTIVANDFALFSQFVAATPDGDYNTALAAWNTQMKPVIEANPAAFGLQAQAPAATATVPAVAPAAQPTPAPPTVLGTGGTAGVTTPPTVPQGDTLDAAISGFFDDLQKMAAGNPDQRI